MSNALMIRKVVDPVDEDRQTEEMLQILNMQTKQHRDEAEMMHRMRQGRLARRYAQQKQMTSRWDGVKQVAFCTLCTAALYGFENIGLPHTIALLGMLFLASYATVVAVTVVAGDIFRSTRMKRKGCYR